MQQFRQLFFSQYNLFGLDRSIEKDEKWKPYVALTLPYRTHNGDPFSLLEESFIFMERDLKVTRNNFTKYSLLEMTQALTNLQTLFDLKNCSLLSSLKWDNILTILKELPIHYTYCVFIISVVLKTNTPNISPIIIKLKYKMSFSR